MNEAWICDGVRTPFGRYGGALASIRTDDLATLPLRALMDRNPTVDWNSLDDVLLGCANQAGEDNRNVARMAVLLAGLPVTVPATTINRLCGSSLDAAAMAARAIKCGEAELVIAGGVESMTRAPFVMAKAEAAFARGPKLEDTTLGWRFVNPKMQAAFGIDSMAETAENVAKQFRIERCDQDAFALRSQQRWRAANARGFFAHQLVPVQTLQTGGAARTVVTDEPPRPDTTLAGLAKLKPVVRSDGTVTAGNASPLNDGASALLITSEAAAKRNRLTPRARIVNAVAVGVEPRIMGFAPAPAIRKLLERTGLTLDRIDVFELNEAFAAQVLAVIRNLHLPDDEPRVNANGGAIAIGHPLGASGARLVTTAIDQLHATGGRYAICTMCIGVGQAYAMLLERI